MAETTAIVSITCRSHIPHLHRKAAHENVSKKTQKLTQNQKERKINEASLSI
jgi:hypothetical protein